jgi:hypothetical protein
MSKEKVVGTGKKINLNEYVKIYKINTRDIVDCHDDFFYSCRVGRLIYVTLCFEFLRYFRNYEE